MEWVILYVNGAWKVHSFFLHKELLVGGGLRRKVFGDQEGLLVVRTWDVPGLTLDHLNAGNPFAILNLREGWNCSLNKSDRLYNISLCFFKGKSSKNLLVVQVTDYLLFYSLLKN